MVGPASASQNSQSKYRYEIEGKKIFVAGHRGMVGSAIVRRLQRENCEIVAASRPDIDLRNSDQVREFFNRTRPNAVFLAAAKVGGILANATYPADFLYDNLMIEANVAKNATEFDVERLVFLGSSCIYPKFASQPIPESALLTGPLEPTSQWYAVAKIAGIKLVEAYREQFHRDFVSAMPTNLYGPGDNYDLQTSHVVPALIRKAHEAKTVGATSLVIWGSGSPRREFLHVDDCADALLHIMKWYSDAEHINVGSGDDMSIADLAKLICRIVGFKGDVVHDISKPDGTPRKLMDSSKLRVLGWEARISVEEGLASTYQAYLASRAAA
jgi:GDP-L-fucose synthase